VTGATAFSKTAACGSLDRETRLNFLARYPNRSHYIYRAPGAETWITSRFRLATGLIDAAISAETDTLYGAFFGAETTFAVFDIDSCSSYHSPAALRTLRENLAAIELSGNVLFQSSFSDGWHLYIPFTNWENSKDLERSLKAWLRSLGYDIRSGQLEVFPCGNGLRLPLQTGFAWLNEAGTVTCKREDLSVQEAVSYFLTSLENNSNNWQIAKTLIESHLSLTAAAGVAGAGTIPPARKERLEMGGFEDLFSGGKIQEKWDQGRKFWQDGLASSGERHNAIQDVGHYLWYGDAERGIAPLPGARHDEYRARLIEEWLTEKHNGFCRHIDQDKWETIRADIKRAVLWRASGSLPEYEPYRLTDRLLKRLIALFRKTGKVWTVADFRKANEDRRDEARCKIRAVVARCLDNGWQISRNSIAAMTGCSVNTVKKHADLWQLFSTRSGDYSPGGLGASLACLSLVLDEPEIIKELPDSEIQDLDIQNTPDQASAGNCLNFDKLGVFKNEKASFILPYGALAASSGSDSVPLRRRASHGVLTAIGDLNGSRRHNTTEDQKQPPSRTAERAVKLCLNRLTALPGPLPENHEARAPVSMAGEASVYRLVIDTGGK